MAVIRELINRIQFREFGAMAVRRAMESLKTAAFAISRGIAAAGEGLVGLAVDAVATATEIGKSAKESRMSAETFQFFAAQAKAAGKEVKDVRSAFRELNLRAQEAFESTDGKGMAKRFKNYGIAVKGSNGQLRDTTDILTDIANKAAEMEGKGQSSAFMFKELIGDKDVQAIEAILKQGGEAMQAALQEFRQKNFFLSGEEIKKAQEFKNLWGSVTGTIETLGTKIGIALLPKIEKVVTSIQSWLAVNRDLIQQRIGQVADVAATAFDFLWKVIDAGVAFFQLPEVAAFVAAAFDALGLAVDRVKALWEHFAKVAGGSERALMIVGGALALLAGWFLAIPLLIGAGIAALLLFLDELTTWASGGESLIGEFLGHRVVRFCHPVECRCLV